LLGSGWLGPGEPPSEVAVFRSVHYPEFLLEDPFGRYVTHEDFRGRFMLVLFGFTQSPETCPMTLSVVSDVMDDLDEKADQVQPIFISVDPERDVGTHLARYTDAFHPAILGLTGSPGALLSAARTFHVFYDRDLDATESDGFDMAHSSWLILLGPDGGWVRNFRYGTSAAAISADLSARLE
jgi:protein SCO1